MLTGICGPKDRGGGTWKRKNLAPEQRGHPRTSDETIRDMAGHVSRQMLKHDSHIGMEAKRRAVESLVPKKQ